MDYFKKDSSEILKLFKTSVNGLSSAEVEKRL